MIAGELEEKELFQHTFLTTTCNCTGVALSFLECSKTIASRDLHSLHYAFVHLPKFCIRLVIGYLDIAITPTYSRSITEWCNQPWRWGSHMHVGSIAAAINKKDQTRDQTSHHYHEESMTNSSALHQFRFGINCLPHNTISTYSLIIVRYNEREHLAQSLSMVRTTLQQQHIFYQSLHLNHRVCAFTPCFRTAVRWQSDADTFKT